LFEDQRSGARDVTALGQRTGSCWSVRDATRRSLETLLALTSPLCCMISGSHPLTGKPLGRPRNLPQGLGRINEFAQPVGFLDTLLFFSDTLGAAGTMLWLLRSSRLSGSIKKRRDRFSVFLLLTYRFQIP